MKRRLFTILLALSLLLCVAVVVMWVRSDSGGDARHADRVGFNAFGCRYTVKRGPGGITLRGPPPVPEDELARAQHAVWDLTNRDVRCRLLVTPGGDGGFEPCLAQVFLVRDPAWPSRLGKRFERLSRPALWRALVPNLEDPERFAAAHVLLGSGTLTNVVSRARKEADLVEVTFNGLEVRLRPEFEYDVRKSSGEVRRTVRSEVTCQGKDVVLIDPTQRGRILTHWQDQFDIDVVTLPYWFILSVLLAPTVLWAFARTRTWRRRSRGLCPRCEYDLRATPERCPECGRVGTAK